MALIVDTSELASAADNLQSLADNISSMASEVDGYGDSGGEFDFAGAKAAIKKNLDFIIARKTRANLVKFLNIFHQSLQVVVEVVIQLVVDLLVTVIILVLDQVLLHHLHLQVITQILLQLKEEKLQVINKNLLK